MVPSTLWKLLKEILQNANLAPLQSHDRASRNNLARLGLLTDQEKTGGVSQTSEFIHLDQRWTGDGEHFHFKSLYPPLPNLPLQETYRTAQIDVHFRQILHDTMIKFDINTDFLEPSPTFSSGTAGIICVMVRTVTNSRPRSKFDSFPTKHRACSTYSASNRKYLYHTNCVSKHIATRCSGRAYCTRGGTAHHHGESSCILHGIA